jgi:hypothetical protein
MEHSKREKPKRINDIHSCYEGHDCEEKWTIENHLAEALETLSNITIILGNIGVWADFEPDVSEQIMKIKHHIYKAWGKSK